MADLAVIETTSLGDRSYLAYDGEVGVVVDPQRDVDRVLAVAGRVDVRIGHVVETHIHNDYVSGGLELARLTGATYAVAAADGVGFGRLAVAEGDVLQVSPGMRLRVLATPGHTFNHVSYVLEHDGDAVGAFTGGSLLYGTTGRTDLLGDDHAERLARSQHASARRLADLLPDGAFVWPTHGFGSFCSVGGSSADGSTLGRERLVNPALRLAEDEFVAETLRGLDAYPAYYAHMGVINTRGPAPIDLTPPQRAEPAEVRRRVDAGEWVVDLRSRKAYGSSHLAGTVSLGLDGPMATWLGWLIDWGAPLTLLGDDPEQVADAQRELARIGIEPTGAATGDPQRWAVDPAQLTVLARATFADYAAARADAAARSPEETDGLPASDVLLDVRLDGEWRTDHIEGAVHVPLPELRGRLAEIPDGTVWVHCGSGYRAAAAASLLRRHGREVVLIDDEYDNAGPVGLPLTPGQKPHPRVRGGGA